MISEFEYEVIEGVPYSKSPYTVKGCKLFLVNTMEEWKHLFQMMMQQKRLYCDTETSGFNYWAEDRIVGMSFGWGDTHFYVPVRHSNSISGGVQPDQLNMDDLRADLVTLFARKDLITVWFNAKFDFLFYLADDIPIKTPFEDMFLKWKFFDENAPAALKTISAGWRDDLGRWRPGLIGREAAVKEKELDKWRATEARARRKAFTTAVKDRADQLRGMIEYQSKNKNELKRIAKEELVNHEYADTSKEDVHYGYVPITLMVEYAALDTFLTMMVDSYLQQNLTLNKSNRALYINELKVCRVLQETQANGVRIDRPYLKTLQQEFAVTKEERLQAVLELIKTTIRDPDFDIDKFNLNSNEQLAKVLINCGVALSQRTPSAKDCLICTGRQSGDCYKHIKVDEKVLGKLKYQYPLIAKILEYRAVDKLKGTYADAILDVLTEDNVLHTEFNQAVKTGRMSSLRPNVQNIPRKDKSIRKSFINWHPDYTYVFIDYSQVEVRLTAHLSQDPLLMEAYALNQDVHTRTMCEVFNYPYEEVFRVLKQELKDHPMYDEWDFLRTASKIINFSIIYGSGALGLSEQIPKPKEFENRPHQDWIDQCEKYIKMYKAKYRGVDRFIRMSSAMVARDGYIINHYGRVRHLPHVNAVKITKDRSKRWLEARAKRQGTNFLVQSLAGDMFKIAIVRVADILRGTKSRFVNFVHDEIQFYMHKDDMHLVPQIKAAMEDFQFTVPIVADVSYSTTNWSDKRATL